MSSAETATEIKAHLTTLQKSRTLRSRKKSDIALLSSLDRSDALTLDKLRRIFTRLHDEGCFDNVDHPSSGTKNRDASVSSASAKWSMWLNTQYEQFVSVLTLYIGEYDKVYAMRTFCGLLATFSDKVIITSSSSNEKREMLSEKLLTKALEAVFKSKKVTTTTTTNNTHVNTERSVDEALLNMLNGEFIQQYRDVQYYVLMVVQKLAVQLLTSLEKESGDANGSTAADGVEQNVQAVAENMARLLLKMDYIAKSQEDLTGDDASYLFPPAVSNEQEADEEDVEQEETESESDATDDSDSSDDEDDKPGKKSMSNNAKKPKKSKLSPVQKAYNHRNLLQEAWLSLLRLPIPPRTTKQILQHLSTYILPIVPTPLRFAEYFTQTFRNGTSNNANNGLTAILSLHGLFQLILNHQLEYPQFYPSLYKLLHPRILYTKHRSRFLRLLSKSLMSNSMLPAYVVAAFCKKLLRLGLSGPPSGALFVLALVSNLVRKHGEVGCLIHRRGVEMEDVFCEDAEDLIETRGEYLLVCVVCYRCHCDM